MEGRHGLRFGGLLEPLPQVRGASLRRRARIHAGVSLLMTLFACGFGIAILPQLLPGPAHHSVVFWAGIVALGPYYLAFRWSRQGRLERAATMLAFTSSLLLLASAIGQTHVAFFAINGIIISVITLPLRTSALLILVVNGGTELLWLDPNVDASTLHFVIIGNVGVPLLLFLGGVYIADQEAERRAVGEQMRLMIEDAPDAILRLSEAGEIMLCNPAAEVLCGQDVTKLEGATVQDLGICTTEQLRSVQRQGYLLQSGQLLRSDGTQRYFEAHLTEDESGYLASIRDTTEQVLARGREERLEQALEESRRLETVGRLAGGVAHDFNNQLTVIFGACTLLRTSPSEEFLTLVETAAEHAAALTEQLLRFARETPQEASVFSCEVLLEELRKMLETLVRDSIELKLELVPDARVRLDPTQLRQVLINIVANASDAMPDGGTITIETKNRPLEDLDDDAPVKGPEGLVTIVVRDEGHGMSQETADRVFEPFYTTKKAGEGTGLGLATTYGIVTQAGGTIKVESTLGRGTSFIIELPRYSMTSKPAISIVTSDSKVASLAGLQALVVDDLPSVGRTTRAVLESAGMVAEFAHGPLEALRLVNDENRTFDLLVSDVVMPGMSGPKLLVQLRKSLPDLKVLFVSGYTAKEDLAGELLLHKPYSVETLLTNLESLMSERKQLAPSG